MLLSAHMVEHLLLMSFAPPLLLLGWPVVPLLRGLPRGITVYVFGPLIRIEALRKYFEQVWERNLKAFQAAADRKSREKGSSDDRSTGSPARKKVH